MKVYHYHPETTEYLGETGGASLDPLETKVQGKEVFLLPAYATFELPLDAKKNEKAVFLEVFWQCPGNSPP